MNVNVFAGRSEDFPGMGDIVTLRAVERCQESLPIAARLVVPTGRLVLLIGRRQMNSVRHLAPAFDWSEAIPIPLSEARILIIGHNFPTKNRVKKESRL